PKFRASAGKSGEDYRAAIRRDGRAATTLEEEIGSQRRVDLELQPALFDFRPGPRQPDARRSDDRKYSGGDPSQAVVRFPLDLRRCRRRRTFADPEQFALKVACDLPAFLRIFGQATPNYMIQRRRGHWFDGTDGWRLSFQNRGGHTELALSFKRPLTS